MEKPDMGANFSTLVMSIASSAAMSLGLAPDPQSGQVHKDKSMAKFNIDLLIVLRDKTKNNLTADEQTLVDSLISDLQMHYVKI